LTAHSSARPSEAEAVMDVIMVLIDLLWWLRRDEI
jgi:hypothetical protein